MPLTRLDPTPTALIPLPVQTAPETFAEYTAFVAHTVAASSARVYAQTYAGWQAWCAAAQRDLLDLRPVNVLMFLAEQNTTKKTRQRQLSALRKLAQMIYVLVGTEDARRAHEALMVIKAPLTEGSGQERSKHALTPSEADKVLRAWDGASRQHHRNRALVAVLALGALRRSEAVVLQWQDIDFENGVITVRHGKGDKQREVPLAGDYTQSCLRAWHDDMDSDRVYVFCAVPKGDKLGGDLPLTGTDVYRIVKATEALSGVPFNPHDLRRTYITEALATGTPLATVQAAAGHARGDTTLHYAQAVNARLARETLKFRYG